MSPRYSVPCRSCGAEPGDRCRTLTTGRVTDTHLIRIHDEHNYRIAQRRER